jgi:hypothetical protein
VGISVNTTATQIAVSVSNQQISASVGGGIGPQGPSGSGGTATAGVVSINGLTGTLSIASAGGVTASGTTITIGGGSGGVSDGNKGDITVSASGTVWAINAGAIVAADIASSAYATAAQARAGNDTDVLMSPRRVRDAIVGSALLRWNNGVTANGGVTGTTAATPGVRSLTTTTATNSYAQSYIAGPGSGYVLQSSSSSGVDKTDWTKPVWRWIRIWRQTGSTNSNFRFLYGATSISAPSSGSPFAQTLTSRGIGWEIVGRRLWVICHDGTTLTTFDTTFDTEANGGKTMDFLLYSDAAGNVSVTYSAQGVGPTTYSTTGGPTAEGTGVATTIQLTNNSDAVACTFLATSQWGSTT